MNCDEARQLIHAYLDDELDIATALRMEAHLPDCSTCRKQLESAKVIGRAAGQNALYHPAPSALRDRLKQAIRTERQEREPASPPRITMLRWKQPTVLLAMAAALVLAVGATLFLWQPRATNTQVVELVDAHLRSLEPTHLLDVESTDQHTVKPWFAGKLDFSPPVIDLAADGYPMVGGRLDYLDQTKAAALVYRHNKHTINVFIRPGEGAAETQATRGFNLIRFQYKGMICWAVSDLNAGELQRFVDLFTGQSPPSTHS